MATQHPYVFTSPHHSGAIRALWWKQPFASLMLHGKIETRKWSTDYRGLVLICASKKEYGYAEINNVSGEVQHDRIADTLDIDYLFPPNGVAIAVGELVDCRPMSEADSDACFVEYREPWFEENKRGIMVEKRLYCHIYKNVRAIEPFEFAGCQGWLNLTAEKHQNIIDKIKYI